GRNSKALTRRAQRNARGEKPTNPRAVSSAFSGFLRTSLCPLCQSFSALIAPAHRVKHEEYFFSNIHRRTSIATLDCFAHFRFGLHCLRALAAEQAPLQQ